MIIASCGHEVPSNFEPCYVKQLSRDGKPQASFLVLCKVCHKKALKGGYVLKNRNDVVKYMNGELELKNW